jgi:hypothetical protein
MDTDTEDECKHFEEGKIPGGNFCKKIL